VLKSVAGSLFSSIYAVIASISSSSSFASLIFGQREPLSGPVCTQCTVCLLTLSLVHEQTLHGIAAAAAFAAAAQVNVLNNLSVAGLLPLVGPGLARLLSWGIRGGGL
jgi:hypothetical protein